MWLALWLRRLNQKSLDEFPHRLCDPLPPVTGVLYCRCLAAGLHDKIISQGVRGQSLRGNSSPIQVSFWSACDSIWRDHCRYISRALLVTAHVLQKHAVRGSIRGGAEKVFIPFNNLPLSRLVCRLNLVALTKGRTSIKIIRGARTLYLARFFFTSTGSAGLFSGSGSQARFLFLFVLSFFQLFSSQSECLQ